MKTLNLLTEKKYTFGPFNSQKYKPKTNKEKLRTEKREFLKEFSTKYGYNGTTTFTKSALTNFNNDLLSNLTEILIQILLVLRRVLCDVIFTQNATAAIKLTGEMFPWTGKSTYKYLRESHNSINGLRRFLETINPKNIQGVTENDVEEMINNPPVNDESEDDEITYNLFAYPAQFLLDAAAYVPSAQLSLADKETSPDFICLSFYKMFGFPTGLGALIIKSELNPILRKGYFGGGTTNSVVYDKTWQVFSEDIATRYEDGTINFLNIIALDHALMRLKGFMETLKMYQIM
ncbi:unnamed protein product [Rhizophagus irregularis]|nr:unnamed protein product [Rhizophagus irregularis]